ncbi:MAG: DUF4349 domain-containing protein [Phycisphaerales bacterium]
MTTTDTSDPIERALADLTTGPYDPDTAPPAAAGLWQKALDQAAPAPSAVLPIWKRRIPNKWLAAASVLLLLGVCASVFTPASRNAGTASVSYSIPSVNSRAVSDITEEQKTAFKTARNRANDADKGVDGWAYGSTGLSPAPITQGGGGLSSSDTELYTPSSRRVSDPASTPPLGTPTPSADRYVIRKTTLDLTTTDVRAAFAKAALVINEAVGEYIEASSMSGEGQNASATITLRVAAAHQSDALNRLRALGTVASELTNGQDVTDSVVDLDSRIRNEQRIEKEILALLDKRPDAPLKDVMDIRSQLESVRARVEQLIGQRDRIGRLVSLSTILVTIKPADAPKPAEKPAEKPDDSVGAYFKSSIASAWRTSLIALVDTAGFLVRAVIGGAPWWLALASIAILTWQAVKRIRTKLAAEPAPLA